MPATTKLKKNMSYAKMQKLSYQAQIYGGINATLNWDYETYMPPAAAGIRGEQLEELAGHIHHLKTGRKWANALSKLIDLESGDIVDSTLTTEQQAAAKKWRRDYLIDTALPERFVKEFAKVTSHAILVWREARKDNAFNKFAPFLEKLVSLNKKKAEFIGYNAHPYDALLVEYEPGMTTEKVGHLFGQLKHQLKELLAFIQSQPPIDAGCLYGKFPTDDQMRFGKQLLEQMGFEMEKGRLDLSTHPFSSSAHPTDSRITTRVHEDYILSNIAAVLHEGGHSLYEMGLNPCEYGTPLGHSISMGMHESQSRWWETRIGLSRAFWEHTFPLLQKAFPGKFDHIKLDAFYKAANRVHPSLIRVEADEVTYPLHVILRFNLEKQLIEGTLNIKEVPEVWNSQMKELLGITPDSNRNGCLQDIHWSMGAFGYFPTYSLGNMYAAQLFLKFSKDHPDWENKVRSGEFLFIKQWLHDHVYRYGRQYDSHELVEKATGQPFSAKPYADYLSAKYRAIYGH